MICDLGVDKMDFKDKILQVRAQLNLTQEQLARELIVAYVTINRFL